GRHVHEHRQLADAELGNEADGLEERCTRHDLDVFKRLETRSIRQLGLFEHGGIRHLSWAGFGTRFPRRRLRGLGLCARCGWQPVQTEQEHGCPRYSDQTVWKLD